mmetsp:Transcript_32404/g.104857  ORF Transcript_32404/g.104857 Transcript_32404/m.104857 type:complete len:298 (-) Transcript_32404:283-1176(-)
MWWTRTRGMRCSRQSESALRTPTSRQSAKPGPTVTATAERSAGETAARRSASATVPSMAARCDCCASFGTTPPHSSCTPTCDAIASARTVPSPRTTAAPVSSQDDSIPSTSISRRPAPSGTGGTTLAAACPPPASPPPPPAPSPDSPLPPSPSPDGSAGGGSGGSSTVTRPAATHSASIGAQRGPTAVTVAARPAACGPIPPSRTSTRCGECGVQSCGPSRCGHSTRQTLVSKADCRSTRPATRPSGSRYGSRCSTRTPGSRARPRGLRVRPETAAFAPPASSAVAPAGLPSGPSSA